jgi:hypothetical protein
VSGSIEVGAIERKCDDRGNHGVCFISLAELNSIQLIGKWRDSLPGMTSFGHELVPPEA